MHLGGLDFRLSPITKTHFSSAAAITGGIRDATNPQSPFAWLTKGSSSSRLLLPDLVLWHFPTFLYPSNWLHTYLFPLQASQQPGVGESLSYHWPGWPDVPTGQRPWQFKPVVLVSAAPLDTLTILGDDSLSWDLWENWAPHRLLGNSCWMLRSPAQQGSWGCLLLTCGLLLFCKQALEE